MGSRTQLKPQSRIHRKSFSRKMPSFLKGKYFIQSGSVEKYSSRLKPYQRGLFANSLLRESDLVAAVLWAADASRANEEGTSAAEASAAADFSRRRRVKRGDPGVVASNWLLSSIVPSFNTHHSVIRLSWLSLSSRIG